MLIPWPLRAAIVSGCGEGVNDLRRGAIGVKQKDAS